MEIGNHLIVDIFEISNQIFKEKLSQENIIDFENLIECLLKENNLTILDKKTHFFESDYPGAFTLLYLLSESHLSIHTWPQKNYLALDLFTCRPSNPQNILDDILKLLETKSYNIRILKRCTGP
jgi:S-adenosylmethionine decarboxylase proenzyme